MQGHRILDADFLGIDAQLFQLSQHICLTLGHIQAHFGIGVEITAMGDGFVLERKSSFVIVHTWSSSIGICPEWACHKMIIDFFSISIFSQSVN